MDETRDKLYYRWEACVNRILAMGADPDKLKAYLREHKASGADPEWSVAFVERLEIEIQDKLNELEVEHRMNSTFSFFS